MISFDCAAELNQIVNHPEIIGGHLLDGIEPPLDVSSSLERGGFGVLGDGFGFLLDPVTPGVFEDHTSILPEHRNQSVDITLKSMAEVFTQTSAMEIVTRIKDNKAAKRLALSVGMQKTFERGETEYFSIHISKWAAGAEQFRELGKEFHSILENSGVETDHGEDENHDQYVGITVAMAKAAMFKKAIWFYNAWAKLAGFHPAELIDDDKAFIGNAIVQITENEMKGIRTEQANGVADLARRGEGIQ